MPFPENLKKSFDEFRKKKYAIWVGMALTTIICIILLTTLLAYFCFMALAIALLAYGIPYFFGLRSKKKLAIFGLVLFLILGIALGTSSYMRYDGHPGDVVSSQDNVMVNGTVTPYRGTSLTTYQFSVELVGGTPSSQVRVNITDLMSTLPSLNLSMTPQSPVSGGYRYVANTTVWEGLFAYNFLVYNGTWTATSYGYGPLSMETGRFFTQLLSSGIMGVFLNIAILFFLFLILSWWMEAFKVRREKLQKEAAEKKSKDGKTAEEGKGEPAKPGKGKTVEKFVCSECGADVPADAKKCPQCGEPFEEDKGEYICTECGAKVKESDAKCWNCGKELKTK